jgi:hypothetical protein
VRICCLPSWRGIGLICAGALTGLLALPPNASAAPRAVLDWSMPARLHGDDQGRVAFTIGADASVYSDGGLEPRRLEVVLDACRSRAGGSAIERYVWVIGTQTIATRSCQRKVGFPREGVYDVRLIVEDRDGGKTELVEQVTVQDWLVVSIGDSVASGEGNPDAAAGPGDPQWRFRRCHRSGAAGPARAALQLERRDPQTSVTFVHLACSGATITHGLLGSYAGAEDDGPPLRPQLDELAAISRRREVDAVLLSVGANDVEFSWLVKYCMAPGTCARSSWLNRRFERRLALLNTLYGAVAQEFAGRLRLPPDRVFATEYFNPARDETRRYCGRRAGDAGDVLLETAEWEWAEQRVLTRLNRALEAATALYDWRYVGGIDGFDDEEPGFIRHGYCSRDRWIVKLSESDHNQRGLAGTLHPNAAGHAHYGRRLISALTADLYPSGDARAPDADWRSDVEPAQAVPDAVLAQQFRPHLMFDYNEEWRPLDVDRFLQEGHHVLCTEPPEGVSSMSLFERARALFDTPEECHTIRRAVELLAPLSSRTHRWLDINGRHGGRPAKRLSLQCNLANAVHIRLQDCDAGPAAALYYNVVRRGTVAAIDYWWFFRFNDSDPGGDHQADWEGLVVTVDLARPGTFTSVSYPAHNGAPWRYPREILRCDGGLLGSCGTAARPLGSHVHVFVANGSHAAYPAPCSRGWLGSCGQNSLLPERGFDGRLPWTLNAGALLPLRDHKWYEWPGKWGDHVDSPASQARFKDPFAARESHCKRSWCQSPLGLVAAHRRSCGTVPTLATATICAPAREFGSSAPTTIRVTRSRGPGSAPTTYEILLDERRYEIAGDPLSPGEVLTLSGDLPKGLELFAIVFDGTRRRMLQFETSEHGELDRLDLRVDAKGLERLEALPEDETRRERVNARRSVLL